MAQGQEPGGLDGWLACDGYGRVVPPPAESEVSAWLGLAGGDPCPLCDRAGGLRKAWIQDLLRQSGES